MARKEQAALPHHLSKPGPAPWIVVRRWRAFLFD